jgi:AcrR family transcriptional regulator
MPRPLPPSRQERRKQRTRRRLLDAARQVIGDRGYAATNVLDITEAADVSKGTFYQHFKDKETLTQALIMEGFEELNRRINADFGLPPGPERMRATLQTVFEYANDNRDLFRIMLGPEASAELNMFAFTYYAGVVEDILKRFGITARTLPYPPALLAQFIAGAGVRMGLWWMQDDHGLSPADMGEIMHQLLTQGIAGLLDQTSTPSAIS